MSREAKRNVDCGPNANRAQADRLIEIIEELPTLDEADLKTEWYQQHKGAALWHDEDGAVANLGRKYHLPAIGLPGFGETRDDPPCGTPIPHVCEDCGQPLERGRCCEQSRCPRCAPKWVMERAVPNLSRIWSAAKMLDGAAYKHHVAVEIHDDLWVDAEDPVKEVFSVLQEFCREINFNGVILYHPWRGDNPDDEGAASEHDDRGEWKKRLFSNRPWDNDVREELRHSPHFHLVGTAPWFPGGEVTKRIYEKTNWLFHRIHRRGSSVSLGDWPAVARALLYSLSHVGVDCRGDVNRARYTTVGSAFHAADDRHHEPAREIIKAVAPETLGIPSMDIECDEQLPEEEASSDTVPELAGEADDLDDLDDLDATESASDASASKMVKCKGDPVPIEMAEFVVDDDWQQRALHAEQAVAIREEWDNVGGWHGWIDRDQLTLDDVLERIEEDPPPD